MRDESVGLQFYTTAGQLPEVGGMRNLESKKILVLVSSEERAVLLSSL